MHLAPIQRLAIGAAAMLTASLVLANCGGADAEGDDGAIRVAHNSNAGVLPVRIADEQGYFEDEGIDVKFTKVENIGTLPPALGKSFDIVLTPPTSLISAKSQGIDMVAAAGATVDVPDNPTSGVVALKSSGISSFKDLKGKKLGVLTETGTLHTATLFALDKAGVSADDIEIVQVDGPAQADQLNAGRIDAVETLAPFRAGLLASGDAVDIGDPYLEMAPEIGALLWGASSDWANEHPDEIEGFRKAIAKAITYIGSHEEEALQSLEAYTGLPHDVVEETVLPNYVSDVRPQDLEIWLRAMKSVGGFEGDVSLDDLVPAKQ
ncbi:MAG: ABC transporter substrate-binding protein [Actinomycetia bacterium]|nr:ABC transporter substrate-binding protein [Actinomycetes bacterium]